MHTYWPISRCTPAISESTATVRPAYLHGQDALDGVSLDVRQVLTADTKVAEGDSREGDVAVLGPVATGHHLLEDVHPEGVVLGRQDGVEKEQLADDVADVADFRKEEEHDQIVAKSEISTCASFVYRSTIK